MGAVSERFAATAREDGRLLRRGLLAGLGLSILAHGLALDQAGAYWAAIQAEVQARSERVVAEEASVEIAWDPPEERFAEANPDVPENAPDPTPLIAARDQQAAQPEPETGTTNVLIPDAGGDIANPKVVEATDVSRPELPSGLYAATEELPETVGESAPEALRGGEILEGVEPIAGGVVRESPEFLDEPPKPAETSAPVRLAEGEPEGPEGETIRERDVIDLGPQTGTDTPVRNPSEAQTAKPPGRPMPRPRLSPDVLRGPVMRSDTGSFRAGALAVESRFTEFGAYQQRMYEAISAEWNRLAYEVGIPVADRPSRVLVRFAVDANGAVSEVEVVETTAGILATQLCTDAIQARAPYGEWTESMRNRLGDLTEVRIGFRYY